MNFDVLNNEMSLFAVPEILVEGDKHNDSCGDKRKDYICSYFFTVGQAYITKKSPQERDTYGLTICYFSTCHAYLLLLEVKGGGSAWTRSTSGISSREGKPKKAYLKTLH